VASPTKLSQCPIRRKSLVETSGLSIAKTVLSKPLLANADEPIKYGKAAQRTSEPDHEDVFITRILKG
jgi:hypothetical protein